MSCVLLFGHSLSSCFFSGTSEVAGVRRRERQVQLAAKVQDMHQRLQESEEERTRPAGWSPYLIMAAFASVLLFVGLKWLFFWEELSLHNWLRSAHGSLACNLREHCLIMPHLLVMHVPQEILLSHYYIIYYTILNSTTLINYYCYWIKATYIAQHLKMFLLGLPLLKHLYSMSLLVSVLNACMVHGLLGPEKAWSTNLDCINHSLDRPSKQDQLHMQEIYIQLLDFRTRHLCM